MRFTSPASTTTRTSSMVMDVSAMLVASTIFVMFDGTRVNTRRCGGVHVVVVVDVVVVEISFDVLMLL